MPQPPSLEDWLAFIQAYFQQLDLTSSNIGTLFIFNTTVDDMNLALP